MMMIMIMTMDDDDGLEGQNPYRDFRDLQMDYVYVYVYIDMALLVEEVRLMPSMCLYAYGPI